jgi:hypothetical protein
MCTGPAGTGPAIQLLLVSPVFRRLGQRQRHSLARATYLSVTRRFVDAELGTEARRFCQLRHRAGACSATTGRFLAAANS